MHMEVMSLEPPNMTWSAMQCSLSPDLELEATDGLQCPPGILELYLYVFRLLQIHFLFALSLARGRAVLALLLHLFVELFHELLNLLALQRVELCTGHFVLPSSLLGC
jgi:hypothetical protein